jgi:anti-sigma regulatory factor (Ser/Thr protein kinase)
MSVATMTTTMTTTIELPPAPESPGSARDFVTGALRRGHVAPETVDIARLLTSELVTNSVVHARTTVTVSVRVSERRVHVAVEDADPTMPDGGAGGALETSGRGLTIVARLAHDWGIEPRTGGKCVWFDLRASRS